MSWTLLAGLVIALSVALVATIARRHELAGMQRNLREREVARAQGSHEARLQYPQVDLTRCIGCGVCVKACPEEGVLELVHGQALVVHGARCVGHGLCAAECPVGAIAVTLGDVSQRTDLPAVTEELEAVGTPGLFLAGEVTGYALIRTAIEHGTGVAAAVARRCAAEGETPQGVLDLLIVGAGPAGLACSLEAKRRGLTFVTIDQEGIGGTVAKYPRRKLVMTQPVDLPLHGRLARTSYSKEELMDIWQKIAAEHELPIRTGVAFEGLECNVDGEFLVKTAQGTLRSRYVCLAMGRRGTPRKLGVPGEELPKLTYSLLDAQSYRGRRLLVVGGGDSAVEAALGLSEQPGNRVTLSYRKQEFSRIKAKNQARLEEATLNGSVALLTRSEVRRVLPEVVELEMRDCDGRARAYSLPNDEVFVMAGGIPPFKLLERSGVSFDPALRPEAAGRADRGTGLVRAFSVGLLLSLAALAWVTWHADYYGIPRSGRAAHGLHDLLRSSRGLGLALGVTAATLMIVNLLYLARRSPRIPLNFGSLETWMSSHVATGILALLCATLHSAMAPGDTTGGHALWGLCVIIITGSIGRYFYAFVPHAANGRELVLEEVRAQFTRLSERLDQGHRAFADRVRAEIDRLVQVGQWRASFARRLISLLSAQVGVRISLRRLRREAQEQGLGRDQIEEALGLARRAHRTALMASHYEDLRGLMATWRFMHRWLAILTVALVTIHVAVALRYGGVLGGGS